MSDSISRQAAIGLLKRWSGGCSYLEYDTESAIYEFERLPSAQPEHNPDDERKIADLHKIVNYLLSQPERKKGEWIRIKASCYQCNQCGVVVTSGFSNFCHRCGADMRGEEDAEIH